MHQRSPSERLGFTLTELMVAIAIFGLLTGGLVRLWMLMGLQSKAGVYQVEYAMMARRVQHRLMDLVQQAKYVEAPSGTRLDLYDTYNRQTVVQYIGDADLGRCRIEVNASDGSSYELCHSVTALEGEPLFETINTVPRATMIRFRIGDDINGSERKYATGPGYQGVDVRFSVQPRNVQRWYD